MKRIKFFDAAVFAFAILIIGGFTFFAYSIPTDSAAVYIKTAEGEWVYPIDSEELLHFHGPIGDTVVEIRNKQVYVISSPCSEKICISSSPIERPGTWVACLPNRIFIRIVGKDEEKEIDAATF